MRREPTVRPVAILGASCRAAAQCASRAGWLPLAADRFADRDLQACAEVHAFFDLDKLATQWMHRFPDLPLLLAGGMENQPDLLDRLRSTGMRVGIDGAMLWKLRDPKRWSQWAHMTGIKWPHTLLETSQNRATLTTGRWLRKSIRGVAGLDVLPWSPSIGLDEGVDFGTETYMQEYVHGESLGATFLSDGYSNRLIGCATSWSATDFPAPGPYVYRGSVGPVRLESNDEKRLRDFGDCVRQESGLRGLWQADFIRNEAGLWLLEINPRWSASMELLDVAWELPLVSLHVTALMDRRASFTSPETTNLEIGKCIVYAAGEITPTQAQLDAWWSQRWTGEVDKLVSGYCYADIPMTNEPIPRGAPILTCFAAHQDRSELMARLRCGSDSIRNAHFAR